MHRSLVLGGFLLLLMLVAGIAVAGEVTEKGSKVSFPDTITLESDGEPVELIATGTGLRTKLRVKVYACVSYVDATADLGDDPAATIIGLEKAKQIHLKLRRDVEVEKITNALREGLEENAKEELENYQEELQSFLAQYTRDLVKDDTLTLTYLPGKGLISHYNDEELGTIESPEFASFVWAIYFGEKPVSGKMKKQMVELAKKS